VNCGETASARGLDPGFAGVGTGSVTVACALSTPPSGRSTKAIALTSPVASTGTGPIARQLPELDRVK
jgi:hypothetical protein